MLQKQSQNLFTHQGQSLQVVDDVKRHEELRRTKTTLFHFLHV